MSREQAEEELAKERAEMRALGLVLLEGFVMTMATPGAVEQGPLIQPHGLPEDLSYAYVKALREANMRVWIGMAGFEERSTNMGATVLLPVYGCYVEPWAAQLARAGLSIREFWRVLSRAARDREFGLALMALADIEAVKQYVDNYLRSEL